jgi:hypothetical protein
LPSCPIVWHGLVSRVAWPHRRQYGSCLKRSPGKRRGPPGVACSVALSRTNFYSRRVPNGAMPFVSTVFGNSPEPRIMNEPKSLYQSPSGAVGPAFTQSCNRRRSGREMRRSSTRLRICSQTGCGRLEKRILGYSVLRILGNSVLSEDRPDQILSRFSLTIGIGLVHRLSLSGARL